MSPPSSQCTSLSSPISNQADGDESPPNSSTMRLLDTETGQFVDFTNPNNVHYAILSHTWDPNGEQTYQELKHIQKCFPTKHVPVPLREPIRCMNEWMSVQETSPLLPLPNETAFHSESSWNTRTVYRLLVRLVRVTPLFFLIRWLPRVFPTSSIWDHPNLSEKIRRACAVARAHGYRYLWIDSCCIDKTSSSELSEAINSMFVWYRHAAVCYAFLADVPDREEEDTGAWERIFRKSRWFTRGWTLQELIAPRTVVFLLQEWHVLGTKSTLIKSVHSATGIDPEILAHSRPLSSVGVATRMSWAARRQATRVEDQAYSLLGIFDINMPTLYGEGDRAFWRLQEEILKRIPDQSLFAWGRLRCGIIGSQAVGSIPEAGDRCRWVSSRQALLARTVTAFDSCERTALAVRPIPYHVFQSRLGLSDLPVPGHTVTPHGICTQIPLVPIRDLFPLERSVVAYDRLQSDWDWYLALLACESESDDLVAFVCGAEPSSSPLRLLQCGFGKAFAPGHVFHLVSLSPAEIERCRPHIRLETVYLPLPTSEASSSSIISDPRPDYQPLIDLSGWTKALLHMQGYEVRSPAAAHTWPSGDSPRFNSENFQCYGVEVVKGTDAIAVRCYCNTYKRPWGIVTTIRLSVSRCDTASEGLPHSGSSRTFMQDGIDCSRRGCPVECLRARFTNSAGLGTLLVRVGIERVSADWLHLHVELTGEGTGTSSGSAGELQNEGMDGNSSSDSWVSWEEL